MPLLQVAVPEGDLARIARVGVGCAIVHLGTVVGGSAPTARNSSHIDRYGSFNPVSDGFKQAVRLFEGVRSELYPTLGQLRRKEG